MAEQALQEFFAENKIKYTVEKLEKVKGSVYKVRIQVVRWSHVRVVVVVVQDPPPSDPTPSG